MRNLKMPLFVFCILVLVSACGGSGSNGPGQHTTQNPEEADMAIVPLAHNIQACPHWVGSFVSKQTNMTVDFVAMQVVGNMLTIDVDSDPNTPSVIVDGNVHDTNQSDVKSYVAACQNGGLEMRTLRSNRDLNKAIFSFNLLGAPQNGFHMKEIDPSGITEADFTLK